MTQLTIRRHWAKPDQWTAHAPDGTLAAAGHLEIDHAPSVEGERIELVFVAVEISPAYNYDARRDPTVEAPPPDDDLMSRARVA